MSTIWSEVTWNIARAGGFTAYILLTCAVVVGLLLSLHIQSLRWPRIINNELHNYLTLLGLIFTVIHVLAVWLDPFTSFGLNEILIPFASHYRSFWMALGIVALYLGLAIGISTWLRPKIGYKLWRSFHYLTFLVYVLVTIHGIATGSDTTTWWAIGMYGASIVLVGTLLLKRIMQPEKPAKPVTPPTPVQAKQRVPLAQPTKQMSKTRVR